MTFLAEDLCHGFALEQHLELLDEGVISRVLLDDIQEHAHELMCIFLDMQIHGLSGVDVLHRETQFLWIVVFLVALGQVFVQFLQLIHCVIADLPAFSLALDHWGERKTGYEFLELLHTE
jgi:hypothetical protein